MEGCSPFGSEDAATTYAIVTGILGMVAGAVNFGIERWRAREDFAIGLPWVGGAAAIGLVFSYLAIADPEIYCGSVRRGGLLLFPFCTGLMLVTFVGFGGLMLRDRRRKGGE